MTAVPELVSLEAAAAMQRAIGGLLAAAAQPQAPPVALFPLYRAMQHLAGAERIHPADLWPFRAPWRTLPAEPFVTPRPPDVDARAATEAALLALMRQADPQACAQMRDLCAELGEGQQGRPATLWKLAAAVYDAQRAQLLKPDVYLKRLGPRLLALVRDVSPAPQTLDLLLRDLLFHCAHAETAEVGEECARLETVVEVFGLARESGRADRQRAGRQAEEAPSVPAQRPASWSDLPLIEAVPGLPAMSDLDLSDLDGWSESPAEPGTPVGSGDPPVTPSGAGSTIGDPSTEDSVSGAAAANTSPDVATPAPHSAAVDARPTGGRLVAADPIDAQFAALERGCAATEDALAALRRHLGAVDDAHEPGSDPVITNGVRLALDAAEGGVAAVTATAQALRVAIHALRLVRFDALTGRLHEHVGQVARESARPIRWALYGGSETVDRMLLDRLVGPVEQLLRLSVEQGIESAALRQQAGKPPAGYVELRISRQVEGLAIDVSDDGAALDDDVLRRAARHLGLDGLDSLRSPEQLAALLGAPGFGAEASDVNADATMRRTAGWARVQPEVTSLGGRLELPLEGSGRTTVRLALRG